MIRTILAENVRKTRRHNNLSIAAFAALTSLTPETIAAIEKEQRDVSLGTLEKLASGCGKTIGGLLR